MSLYIGKDLAGVPSLHITSSYTSDENLKATSTQDNTLFMSGQEYLEYVGYDSFTISTYEQEYALPSNYQTRISDPSYFCIILKNIAGTYTDAVLTTDFSLPVYVDYYTCGLYADNYCYRWDHILKGWCIACNAGSYIILYIKKTLPPPATTGISISNKQLNIGGTNLTAMRILGVSTVYNGFPTYFYTSYGYIYDFNLSNYNVELSNDNIIVESAGNRYSIVDKSLYSRINIRYVNVFTTTSGYFSFFLNLPSSVVMCDVRFDYRFTPTVPASEQLHKCTFSFNRGISFSKAVTIYVYHRDARDGGNIYYIVNFSYDHTSSTFTVSANNGTVYGSSGSTFNIVAI